MKIAVLHPDLGLGGAERLVVDMAMELTGRGHSVTIFTSHYDKNRCFEETKHLSIRSYGTNLPRSIAGGGYLLILGFKTIYMAVRCCFEQDHFDVYFSDQFSLYLPIFRCVAWLKCWIWGHSSHPVFVFYSHYPDKLLVQSPRTLVLGKVYRNIMDWLEEWGLTFADLILVNSRYTKTVFKSVFSIPADPLVLHPGIVPRNYLCSETKDLDGVDAIKPQTVILSINRFERKKALDLAIRAFSRLQRSQTVLVVAGGYDGRIEENVEYHLELCRLASDLGLEHITLHNKISSIGNADVVFLLSISAETRNFLLSRAKVLVYTPTNEHFGLVPLEAMCCGCPVIVMNSGGPLEYIVDSSTGFLTLPTVSDLAQTMQMAISMDGHARREMVSKAKQLVLEHFTVESFVDGLEAAIRGLY